MKQFSYQEIINTLKKKNYKFFDNGTSYNINIIGVRSAQDIPNIFGDAMLLIYRDEKGLTQMKQYTCTTRPGIFYLEHPENVEGTAILSLGQHIGSHKFGKHKGQYPALVQARALPFYRDANHNDIADEVGSLHTELIGCNIHHASPDHISVRIDNWSAACQVLNNPVQWAEFLSIVEKSFPIFGETVTYTLLSEKDI